VGPDFAPLKGEIPVLQMRALPSAQSFHHGEPAIFGVAIRGPSAAHERSGFGSKRATGRDPQTIKSPAARYGPAGRSAIEELPTVGVGSMNGAGAAADGSDALGTSTGAAAGS
jgi:hypothetical protein